MSVLQWIKTNSRALGKGSLYIIGGVAMGWPLIRAGQTLWQGGTVESAGHQLLWQGAGYNTLTGTVYTPQTRMAVVRTILGAGAVYVARKL